MNWAQWLVLCVFTISNIWITTHKHDRRHPASKSRWEQIARIRQQEHATRIR